MRKALPGFLIIVAFLAFIILGVLGRGYFSELALTGVIEPREILGDRFVYYPNDFIFRSGDKGVLKIGFSVLHGKVWVADPEKNLTVRVDPIEEGTILTVKYVSEQFSSYVGIAELVVRSPEHKERWLSAIKEETAKAHEAYEESLKKRDLVPK